MTLDEGATHEINSRWAEYKQRNCALNPQWYGAQYFSNMLAGIQVVRDVHDDLTKRGETVWSIDEATTKLLDELAGKNNV